MRKQKLMCLAAMICGIILALSFTSIAQETARNPFEPAYPASSKKVPKVLFDEAHFNVHTVAGSYKPFVELLTADGFIITANDKKFSRGALSGYDILVISNARGAGPDVPIPERGMPAFTTEECVTLKKWIQAGGSLLLVVDHYPIGLANKILAESLGVDMGTGGTIDPENSDKSADGQSTLIFRRENSLLENHSITNGRTSSERVNKVITFAGTSLKGPVGSSSILKLGSSAIDVARPERTQSSASGRSQAVAFKLGRGRVVILGEAAMITSAGFAAKEYDNTLFTLNVMRWLSGLYK